MENKSLQLSLVGNQIIQLSITADQGQILLKKEHLRRKKLFLSCLDHTWLFFCLCLFACLKRAGSETAIILIYASVMIHEKCVCGERVQRSKLLSLRVMQNTELLQRPFKPLNKISQ